ncbi:MAG: LytTR family DNA-binding domain-containing protein [Halieaceae bacterium]|jgi:two-component system response regulator AlgR|nr:LytTR family DNA-binding domain-containing protein [Halieaceae bacterium]
MKILVVDDESLARERLLRLLQKLQPAAHCWQAADGEQALALIGEHNPDLLLLDVRMPGMSGIELAERLDLQAQPPAVIFCTAYDQYALDALQHQAVAYLLKPVREAELARALAVAGRVNRVQLASLAGLDSVPGNATPARTGQRAHLASQSHRGLETIPVADIRCLLAEQKYVTACSPSAQLLIPDTLKELEREFGDRFLRVHRNALVARAHIVRLQRDEEGTWCVVLDGVEHRPVVSRRHLAQVKQRLVES